MKTAFKTDDSDNNSGVFRDFENYRNIIQSRLNAENQFGNYELNSQDVLIPAFLAAYAGTSAQDVKLNPFPSTPIPNWRLDYAGLGKLPSLRDIFSSFSITHAYSSTYNVNGYTSSLFYSDGNALDLDNDIEDYALASQLSDNGDLVPLYVINQVVISERFSPLIGINIRTKSRFTGKVEYRKERNLALNLSNAQVTELNSSDIVVELGYVKAGMKLPFRVQGQTKVLDNDINFKMQFSIRDTKTTQRKIEEINTVTGGNINFQLRPTISYVLNQKLNLQVYFERNVNEPRISSSFKRSTTQFGALVRFSLSQ